MWEEMVVVLLKLIISIALGGLVGLERQIKRKPACLFTVVSLEFGADPARVASGIVTGIGFIGAGTIMGSKFHVKGITTAATLWVTAAIGLAVGAEMYIPALLGAILVFIVLQMWRIEEELM